MVICGSKISIFRLPQEWLDGARIVLWINLKAVKMDWANYAQHLCLIIILWSGLFTWMTNWVAPASQHRRQGRKNSSGVSPVFIGHLGSHLMKWTRELITRMNGLHDYHIEILSYIWSYWGFLVSVAYLFVALRDIYHLDYHQDDST